MAAEPPVDRHERRLWLEHRIDAPWTLVLVALNGTDAIGYLTAVGSERQPTAIGLGVSKMWRNRGVGTKLVEAAIGWGKDQGVHKLATEVFPHNEPTLHLFEKLGFAREGHLRGHYRRSSGALWDVIVLGLQQLETTTERERGSPSRAEARSPRARRGVDPEPESTHTPICRSFSADTLVGTTPGPHATAGSHGDRKAMRGLFGVDQLLDLATIVV